MGTETFAKYKGYSNYKDAQVKLNNPLMGTETTLYRASQFFRNVYGLN